MGQVHVFDHPLISEKLTLMRRADTSSQDFRLLLKEISELMLYEVARDFETKLVTIQTPICEGSFPVLKENFFTIVPILRAGLGMVDGLLELMPFAHVGHIGMSRDEETKQPIEYYYKMPDGFENSVIIVVDPMLATGGSAVDAINSLKSRGCKNIRLRAGVGMRFRETEEYIKRYGLDEYFGPGKTKGVAPIDEGIPIETEIGTLYGIKAIYDADWIIHAHHTDVREVHFHRQIDKAVKPFSMSYARIESRSTYHQNLGPRAANFTARAIFESEFVQSKFAFGAFLNVGPHGVIGVIADNDLYKINDIATFVGCQLYGKVMTLFGKIDECIAVLDFPCPVPYVFSAGVIYANFTGANSDLYDMEGTPLPAYTWYTEAYYGKNGKPLLPETPLLNPAIKMCVHNYAWTGYPSAFFSEHVPTVVVGAEQAKMFDLEPMNIKYMDYATVAKTTEGAMEFAYQTTGTDKVIIFDGAMGGLNCSESLAKELIEKAPAVSKEVEEVLMPKWFRQRGVDMSVLEELQG